MAKSLSIVSFTDISGCLRRLSATSRRPFVTIDPRAYSIKVVDSSLFCKANSVILSSAGGIFTGNSTLLYFAGFFKNFCNFDSVWKENLTSLYYTIRILSPFTTFPSSSKLTGQ
jgi:hypothetical protein